MVGFRLSRGKDDGSFIPLSLAAVGSAEEVETVEYIPVGCCAFTETDDRGLGIGAMAGDDGCSPALSPPP